jgi:branched-chain amino acid transport system substrate-binding protein
MNARPLLLTLARLALALPLLAGTALAQAQIVIGQTADFSGPAAASVKETTAGAQLYFGAVNAAGGVHGQKIALVSLDDKFDPGLARGNAQVLITERKALALFLTRGTPHTEAILPLMQQHKLALVGPSTGSMVLHQPVQPYVFNVRAPYQREAEAAVRHLSLVGLQRIGVLHLDDSFGADALQGAKKGFEAIDLKPALVAPMARGQTDFAAFAAQAVKADLQALIVVGPGGAVAAGTKALRQAGSRAQIVTLSNNASEGFIALMGEHGPGTIVTQVFPYERSMASGLVKEAAELQRRNGGGDISPAMMEGFAAAKVLVEGLRRAGPGSSREGLVAALNGLGKFDLGGMDLGYSPSDHSGLSYADLSIIGSNGRFRR